MYEHVFVRDMYLCNQPINLSEVTKSGKVHLQHHKLHLLEMSTFEQFQGKIEDWKHVLYPFLFSEVFFGVSVPLTA